MRYLRPMLRLGLSAAAVVVLMLAADAIASYAGVADGYTTPTAVIPYATTKPTIDGVVNPAEWQGALCMTGLQETGTALSGRQTQFYMMWDESAIYVAMRSPLRPNERPIQALRGTTTDLNTVFDDAYELYFNVGSQESVGEPVFFQYIGNFAGARDDVMFEPAVGNSDASWTSHWKPVNTLVNNGSEWDMEVAIPWHSLLMTGPFRDKMTFTGLVARDYKRDWDQVSFGGSGNYSTLATYTNFTLSKAAPAIQMISVANPTAQTFGVDLAAYADQNQNLVWRYASDSGVTKQGTLAIQGGQVATMPAMLGLDQPASGNYRITVASADGSTTYLDWSSPLQFGDLSALSDQINDNGDEVALTLALNPAHDFLRVTGDMINYDNRAAIKKFDVSVHTSSGRLLANKLVKMDKLAYIKDIVTLPALAPGDYSAQLKATDASGNVMFTDSSDFTKLDEATTYPWWNTTLGNINQVVSPWTPVTYASGQFGVWNRTMQVGAVGLPAQITSKGTPLLSQGASLVATLANGNTLSATSSAPATVSTAPYSTVVQSAGKLSTLNITSTVTVQFDGMYRVDMTLTPQSPTEVKSMQIVVPLVNSIAGYLHAGAEGIRTGYDYRFLPQGNAGQIWNSKIISGQSLLIGSFIPYLWLGDSDAGLCWFADGDNGWVPSNTTPAIEIDRPTASSPTLNLVLNLISSDFTIDKPRTITFAFEATPVKPIQSGWRMDTWWTDDTFQDFAQVESEGGAGNEGLIFSSIPFPLDSTKSTQMVNARHATDTSYIMGIHKYHENAVPYFQHIDMGEQFVPAFSYFDDEWRTHVSSSLAYGQTLQDFMVYSVSNWIQDCGIDGFYLDNVAPYTDNNIPAGRGYKLPDGRIQPTFQMFDTRNYLLRMRQAMADQGKTGKFVMHVTDHMIVPWIESADIALDGEDHVIYPGSNTDFMDYWSLERLRLDYPGEWGTAVNFLQEYQGSWSQSALMAAMRAYTGMMLLDDTLASANANGLNQSVWIARDAFSIQDDDVTFLRYWDPSNGMQTTAAGVYISGWIKPSGVGSYNKLLMAVVNTGNATAAPVNLATSTLNLPSLSQCTITNAETGAAIPMDANGSLDVTIPRHDYCQVLIVPNSSQAIAPKRRTLAQ